MNAARRSVASRYAPSRRSVDVVGMDRLEPAHAAARCPEGCPVNSYQERPRRSSHVRVRPTPDHHRGGIRHLRGSALASSRRLSPMRSATRAREAWRCRASTRGEELARGERLHLVVVGTVPRRPASCALLPGRRRAAAGRGCRASSSVGAQRAQGGRSRRGSGIITSRSARDRAGAPRAARAPRRCDGLHVHCAASRPEVAPACPALSSARAHDGRRGPRAGRDALLALCSGGLACGSSTSVVGPGSQRQLPRRRTLGALHGARRYRPAATPRCSARQVCGPERERDGEGRAPSELARGVDRRPPCSRDQLPHQREADAGALVACAPLAPSTRWKRSKRRGRSSAAIPDAGVARRA